jgi:hypothetical protein
MIVGRFYGAVGWIVVGLLALGAYSAVKDGDLPLPGLAEPPWEYVDVTTYKDDCEKAGGATYAAIGDKDGAVLSFERPCSQPPPEDKR